MVVVPVGNSGRRGGAPDYPGAYRHVVTVGALRRDGRVLPLSGRGPQVALAAPGETVVSTAAGPAAGVGTTALVARTGTSMAAAVVSGRRPGSWRRGRGCPPSGCARSWRRRRAISRREDVDSASGAGALDLAAALAAPPPPAEDPEPNDDPRQASRSRALLGAGASSGTVRGRTGSYDDPRDGFRVVLRAGEAVSARLAPEGVTTADLDLALWRPGTPRGVARARIRPHLARRRVARTGRGGIDRRDGARGRRLHP